MDAIVSACSSPLIRCLPATFGKLPESAKEQLRFLATIGDAEGGYKKYKEEVRQYSEFTVTAVIPDIGE